jgi:hypothetical protein
MVRLRHFFAGIIAACALGIAGCGGGSGGTATTPAMPSAAAQYGISSSNLEIATALYQDSARTPAGFYADPAPPGESYVATLHIKSSDVAATATADFELCTDDWNQALQWSEAAAGTGGGYANLVGNSATARYFEFDRLRPGTPQLYLRQRVYLCSYLDRSGTVAGVSTGPAGSLNLRPIGAGDLRQLSEYLWRFTAWNNYGSAVLASEPDPVDTGMAHALVVATLVSNGAAAGCDRIDIVAWRHKVTAGTGALERTLAPLWNFNARQGNAGAENCGS